VSIQQVPEISEIDTIIESMLGTLWEEHGSLDKHVRK
jgi:hypothetical protein